MSEKRDVTALPLGEGTETGSERSGLANPCPGRPEQADDSRIAVSPSPDRSATALPPHDHTIEPGEINRRGCVRCQIERDTHEEDLGVFAERLRELAENWRYSDEMIGLVVRRRWPQRYDVG